MRNLITAQEVIDLAFAENSNMMAESIPETAIRLAEIKYIRPAFGAMYPLLADKYADYTNDYVKPALAYFVKCEIVSSIAIDMSNSGVAVANPQYQSAATDKQRQRLYDSEMSKAKTLLDFALEYIATHSEEFPDFSGEAPKKHHRVGGILLGGGTSRNQSASIAGEAFKAEFDKYIKEMGEISAEVSELIEKADEITESAQKAITASTEATKATISASEKAEVATSNANAATNSVGEVIKQANKAIASANEAAQKAEAEAAKIDSKADKEGDYPNMTVGKAQGVVGISQVQEALTLTTKANGNIVIDNLDGQSKEFMPATPSGDPLHYLFVSIGGMWNANTNFWELFDVKDLSREDMIAVFRLGVNRLVKGANLNMYAIDERVTIPKTNLLINSEYDLLNITNFAVNNPNLEYVALSTFDDTNTGNILYDLWINEMKYAFYGCQKLKTIRPRLYLAYCTAVSSAFDYCFALENVKLTGVKMDISFANSPLLTKESLLYMISNCAAGVSFTITLHPDVYSLAKDFDNGWGDEVEAAIDTAQGNKNTHITLARA